MNEISILEKLKSIKNIFETDIIIFNGHGEAILNTTNEKVNIGSIIDEIINNYTLLLDGYYYYYNKKYSVVYRLSNVDEVNIIVKLLDKYMIMYKQVVTDDNHILRQILLDNDVEEEITNRYGYLYLKKQYIHIYSPQNNDLVNLVKNIWTKDIIIRINDEVIVAICEAKTVGEIYSLYDTIKSELYIESKILIKNSINSLTVLKNIYKMSNNLVSNLDTREDGRLVYFVERNMLRFVLLNADKGLIDTIIDLQSYEFDELLKERELYHTIEVFFENNLNTSEAARKLYIHRNTLVYRLNKIHKITGLDIRNLKDAISCKILMVFNGCNNIH